MCELIKKCVSRLINCFTILVFYCNDFLYNVQNFRTTSKDSKDKSDANIMLLMHALEKGLSFHVKKKEYGKEKSYELTNMLEHHIKLYGIDNQVIVAVNILNEYLKDPFSISDTMSRKYVQNFIELHNDLIKDNLGGVKIITKPNIPITYEQLLQTFLLRSSVRYYSPNEKITEDEIKKAIVLAQTSPSACNRQASRLYVIDDKNNIKSILDNQLGDQGWCNEADKLFVITSNVTYFGNKYERKQAYIDGGMFAMNFDMGLHIQGIASCFKMYVRSKKKDQEFRALINIPVNEVPIVLILAGHYSAEISLSPLSYRNQINYGL